MRGWTILTVTLLVGVAAGATGMRLLPSVVRAYAPAGLGTHTHVSDAAVTKKQREQDRVLLRVQDNDRPVLLTFTRRVPEIDLLIDPGDVITLALPDDQTFVEDPLIERVKRPTPPGVPATRPDGGAR